MADISANLKDWSATAGSNNPAGSTNIGTGLDDNLRQLQATTRQDLATKGADILSATTTDLGAVPGLMHDITGANTITGFGTVSAGIWKILKYEGAATITHNATSLILLGGVSRTVAAGDVQIVMSEGSGNWRELAFFRAGVAIKAPTIQVFTSSDTYTKPTGLASALVEVYAAGGGGSGSDLAGSGRGGAAGGYARELLLASAIGATETVTIGAAGAAGAAAGGTGGTGGTSSFGSLLSATGGVGGVENGMGSLGGVGSGGDVNATGANSFEGMAGANSPLGGGGKPVAATTAGEAATGYAAGGGGADGDASNTRAGGTGAPGIVIVTEFYA